MKTRREKAKNNEKQIFCFFFGGGGRVSVGHKALITVPRGPSEFGEKHGGKIITLKIVERSNFH